MRPIRWSPVWLFGAVLALTLALLSSYAGAQPGPGLTVTWWTMESGGSSSGGNYHLSGTIGQPDAGTLTGTTLHLQGGFLSGSSEGSTSYLPLVQR